MCKGKDGELRLMDIRVMCVCVSSPFRWPFLYGCDHFRWVPTRLEISQKAFALLPVTLSPYSLRAPRRQQKRTARWDPIPPTKVKGGNGHSSYFPRVKEKKKNVFWHLF